MEKRFFEVSALIVLILFFMVCSVFAFPNFINYQGQLTDSSGNSLNGNYLLTFMIYDTETEGEALWTEQHTITVTNGLYNAELGTVNTFPEDLFEMEMLYLEVIIHNEDTGSDETLSPRIPFTSTGFAMKAKDAETVAWSNITGKPATFADDVMYVDGNGNVGIGTSTPNSTFQVIGSISRQGTTLNGTDTDTHVNLGVNSFTDGNSLTVSGGVDNSASGSWSTVSGGHSNSVNGDASTVSGGYSNTASGDASTVSGGVGNTTDFSYSTVSGGAINTASGPWSTVSGGYNNTAFSSYSTVSGGSGNTAFSWNSTVSGGSGNTASGSYSTVSGGGNNTAAGYYSWAGGRNMQLTEDADRTFAWGYSDSNVSISTPDAFIIYSGNVGIGTMNPEYKLHVDGDIYATGTVYGASGTADTDWVESGGNIYRESGNVGIGTGTPNAALQVIGAISRQGATLKGTLTYTHVNLGYNSLTEGFCSTISGGEENTASAGYSTVSGGINNTASDWNSTVSGGYLNTASGNSSTVSGGSGNTASSQESTVSGGSFNTASGLWSTISGGDRNTASGQNSTISGGWINTASGKSSIVSGGENNTAAGDYSWAGGRNMELTEEADRTFVWGYNDSNVSISTPNAFIIYSGNVGIGTTNPASKLNISGGNILVDWNNGEGRVNLGDSNHYIRSRIHIGVSIGTSNIVDGIMLRQDTGNVGIGTTTPSRKLDVTGDVIANAYEQHSDARLKKNIAPIDNALDKVAALRGVEFEWRTEENPGKGLAGGRKIGLIAQEVEKVLPEVVSTDNEGYKSVEYANMVGLLIEAVKAQQLQIEELKSQNTKLQERVDALEGHTY